jgi:hypothetical protein
MGNKPEKAGAWRHVSNGRASALQVSPEFKSQSHPLSHKKTPRKYGCNNPYANSEDRGSLSTEEKEQICTEKTH